MTGIRAELVFQTPVSCPVAQASAEIDHPLTEISWTGGGDETVTEQFAARSECEVLKTDHDGENSTGDSDEEFEQVFDYGAQTIYEFDRDPEKPCICEVIEETVGPIAETYATEGDLHVILHVADVADLREHLREFDRQFGDVHIEYLVSGRTDTDEGEILPVDIRRLTERQREVLETAYAMGYFEYPRGANATEVAEELGIRPSTFTEHLNAAQSKILDELQFGDGSIAG